jgi:phosphatidylglycerophosphate synthase
MTFHDIYFDNINSIVVARELLVAILVVYNYKNRHRPYYAYFWKGFLLILVGTTFISLQVLFSLFRINKLCVYLLGIPIAIVGFLVIIWAEMLKIINKRNLRKNLDNKR